MTTEEHFQRIVAFNPELAQATLDVIIYMQKMEERAKKAEGENATLRAALTAIAKPDTALTCPAAYALHVLQSLNTQS